MKTLMGLIAFFSLSLECIAQTCMAAKDPSKLSIAGGSLTEIVYLLGAEKQIVAVDVTSNYPPKARALPSIGYVRNLSAEGILSLDPTLVLGEDDMAPAHGVDAIRRHGRADCHRARATYDARHHR